MSLINRHNMPPRILRGTPTTARGSRNGAFDGHLLTGAVHPLNLSVGVPRGVRPGKPVLDVIRLQFMSKRIYCRSESCKSGTAPLQIGIQGNPNAPSTCQLC